MPLLTRIHFINKLLQVLQFQWRQLVKFILKMSNSDNDNPRFSQQFFPEDVSQQQPIIYGQPASISTLPPNDSQPLAPTHSEISNFSNTRPSAPSFTAPTVVMLPPQRPEPQYYVPTTATNNVQVTAVRTATPQAANVAYNEAYYWEQHRQMQLRQFDVLCIVLGGIFFAFLLMFAGFEILYHSLYLSSAANLRYDCSNCTNYI